MSSESSEPCSRKCEAMPICQACGRRKAPWGRSIPGEMAGGYCQFGLCPEYDKEPLSGHLWPGELADRDEDGAQGMRRMRIIEEIAAERERQISSEGWSLRHDDQWVEQQLAWAAACYAAPAPIHHLGVDPWPWSLTWDKRHKHDRRRCLVIAAALIVAEMERLDRIREENAEGGAK